MTDRFRGAPLNLRFRLGRAHRVVHEDAELAVLREETTRRSVAVLLEGHGLNGKIEDLTTDDQANEAKEATRNVGVVLGSVLHVSEAKADSRGRNRDFRRNIAGICDGTANRRHRSSERGAAVPGILRPRTTSGFGHFVRARAVYPREPMRAGARSRLLPTAPRKT